MKYLNKRLSLQFSLPKLMFVKNDETFAHLEHGTVLPNGVKVAVWDLSQMFKKWKKKFYHVVCIHIEWIWSNNEQVNTQSL